mmetsp:Transcript_22859/g.73572  ORF Transcript_22859/g.73572 Transcript_22859/m.73572 type:complete len:200 (-) Transcript_22859:36-635(-)
MGSTSSAVTTCAPSSTWRCRQRRVRRSNRYTCPSAPPANSSSPLPLNAAQRTGPFSFRLATQRLVRPETRIRYPSFPRKHKYRPHGDATMLSNDFSSRPSIRDTRMCFPDPRSYVMKKGRRPEHTTSSAVPCRPRNAALVMGKSRKWTLRTLVFACPSTWNTRSVLSRPAVSASWPDGWNWVARTTDLDGDAWFRFRTR